MFARPLRTQVTPGHPRRVLVTDRRSGSALIFDADGTVEAVPACLLPSLLEAFTGVSPCKDSYGCMGLLELPYAGGQGTARLLVMVTECRSVGNIGTEISAVTSVVMVPLSSIDSEPAETTSIVSALARILSSGSFFFATNLRGSRDDTYYDLTWKWSEQRTPRVGPNERYFWNRRLWAALALHGLSSALLEQFLLVTIRGSVQVKTTYLEAGAARAAVISRVDCEHAGQRLHTRGIDDDGNAANFIETEQLLLVGPAPDQQVFSFVQVRGSVPIFWAQNGLAVGKHRVELTRSFNATKPAFMRHIQKMYDTYGVLLIVSLLSVTQDGEAKLGDEMAAHVQCLSVDSKQVVPIVTCDLNRFVGSEKRQAAQRVVAGLTPFLSEHGYYVRAPGKRERRQTGVIRTNCIDCLDRTNLLQASIGSQVLLRFLDDLGSSKSKRLTLISLFAGLWDRNGDDLAQIVTGTGTMETPDQTSKVGLFFGAARNLKKSISRTFQNALKDGNRQEAIDALLGKGSYSCTPEGKAAAGGCDISTKIGHAISTPAAELDSQRRNLRFVVGTWNVAGGKGLDSPMMTSLDNWLINPVIKQDLGQIDGFAVGFQELVGLNASNLINPDKKHHETWLTKVTEAIPVGFSLLTSQQLVGVCLYIFVKNEHLAFVTDVQATTIKTGAGGRAGNKGAVAIRLALHGTPICFVSAHLAAGHKQVRERNDDFFEIVKKISFGRVSPFRLGRFFMHALHEHILRLSQNVSMCSGSFHST